MLDFFTWFRSVNGTYVGQAYEGEFQCMALMHDYCEKVLGVFGSLIAPTAIQSFQNGDPLFTKIINTPWNVPKQGDIVYFGKPSGMYLDDQGKVQYAGHVCVFNAGNVFNFTSIDQNWPIGSKAHVQSHNYWGCLGWLRKK